jgi:Bifunctional DNA primase/polymerase, N-terminal
MRWHCEQQRIQPRRFRRRSLRRAALRYAERGWDIMPGACLIGTRFDCDRPGCHTVSCHPAVPHWEAVAGHDPHLIRAWWSRLHHSVLLATGRTVDALEVPAALGRPILAGVRGPVAVAPSGRLLFLVRPGEGLRPELSDRLDVVLHGLGSWVPIPPTDHPGGRMRWETPPEEYDWQLPDPYAVQAVLLSALRATTEAPRGRPAPRIAPAALRPAA